MEKLSVKKTPTIAHYLKDPGSAITHFIGMLLAIVSAFPLIHRSILYCSPKTTVSVFVFSLTLFLLYFASTSFHSFITTQTINRRLKKFDHMMIYVLIAGTYTPVCITSLSPSFGIPLLIGIWTIALIGVVVAGIWIYTPRWLNSTIYIIMGWLIVLAGKPLIAATSWNGVLWLVAGGIIYTLGGIIYALKVPLFNQRHPYFGTHEIFHLFVIGGSICHYIFIYFYVL